MTRGQRVYDWWSRHEWLLRRLYDLVFLGRGDRFRRETVDALGLAPGDSVLDLGCGTGVNFGRLRSRVGPAGRVVGVDSSRGMVERARERIAAAGWENVAVVHGDATRLCTVRGSFDAVMATMAVSAMPDPAAVAREARRTLGPGGRIAVLDARPFQDRPWTLLNRIVEPVSVWATDWRPDADVVGAIEATFGEVTVSEHVEGTVFVAAASVDPAVHGVS